MATNTETSDAEPSGFPESSRAPIVLAIGSGFLGLGIVGHPIALAIGAILFAGAAISWVHSLAVFDYARESLPDQKKVRNLGYSSSDVGLGMVIASEIMVFGALFAAYFALDAHSGPFPPAGSPHPGLPLAVGLAVVLLASGLTMHWAQNAIEAGNRRRFWYGMAATVVLGLGFLGGQGYEYASLAAEGLTPQSGPFGSTFFALTGTHGLHVVIGLVLIGAIAVRAGYYGHFGPEKHTMVRVVTTYWHFVDAVWVFIVAFVYLRFA